MKPTILNIEDDPATSFYIANLLKEHYDVITQENGLDALMWLKDGNTPSAIIADLNMPRMDGYEFIAKIKSDSRYSKIPLIIISGEASPFVKNRCLKAGANKYITKPFEEEEIESTLQSLVI